MLKYIRYLFFVSLVLLAACSESQRKSLSPKADAIGKAGQVLVVAEGDVWNGMAGEVLRENFMAEFPVLPQPEPRVDIKHVEGIKFNSLRREWRIILILADLSKDSKTTREVTSIIGKEGIDRAELDLDYNTLIREDVWAEGQLIVYLFAPNKAQLVENVQKRSDDIIRKINEEDLKKISANTYQGGINRELKNEIFDNIGVQINVPSSYKLAVFDTLNNEIWLRRETGSISSNILLKTMPYDKESELNEQNLIAIRDKMGKRLITSGIEGAYMISTNTHLDYAFRKTEINKFYALEARGLWELQNDFMGGPFLSYMVYNPNNKKVVLVDGFVHAPGEDKRSLMQQLDIILQSLKF